MEHLNITVSGKVQGVLYRKSAQQKANELGIKGFAQNIENGNVYIEAEGTKENLEKFVNWCKMGPKYAKVESIHIQDDRIKKYIEFNVYT